MNNSQKQLLALVVAIVMIAIVMIAIVMIAAWMKKKKQSALGGAKSALGDAKSTLGESTDEYCHHINSRAFPDLDGYCYTCPKGYIRSTVLTNGGVNGPFACAGPHDPLYEPATKVGKWGAEGKRCDKPSGTIWPFSGCDVSAGLCCHGRCARSC